MKETMLTLSGRIGAVFVDEDSEQINVRKNQ